MQIPSGYHGQEWSLLAAGRGSSARTAGAKSLNTSEKNENDNNEESEAYASRRDIAPLAAVRPPRQSTHECQDQKDYQYSSKHCLLLPK